MMCIANKGGEMPKTVAAFGGLLCAIAFAACTIEDSPPRSDDPVDPSTSSVSELSSDSGSIAATCTIAAWGAGVKVVGHPAYCIKTGPCAQGDALDRAVTFCVNRCGVGCARGNIVQLASCD